MPDPGCTRCGGTGSFETEGDLHRSAGIVPCDCRTPEPPQPWLAIVADATDRQMGREKAPSRRFSEMMGARDVARKVQKLVELERRGPSSTERLRKIAELVVRGG